MNFSTHRLAAPFVALVLGAVTLLSANPGQGPSSVEFDSNALDSPVIQKQVEALLHQMTLDEKVGQLVQYSAGQPTGPGTGRTDYDDMIQKGEVGALFNITTAHQVNAYQHIAVGRSRLHIPLLFGLDVIHGFRTEFPVPLGLATSWNPELVEQAARAAAEEASASGIRWTFSPMVDIARDARWGRMAEGAGEDPFLGAAMARAYVRGYQGVRLDAPDSLAACPKHFVGYGAAEGGRDYNSTEISEHTLRQFYLPPFRAAIDEGAATIMSAFNSLNAVPASANPFTLTQILRREWGFQGIVDSDYMALAELIPHGMANDGATAARKAFLAGVDMDMVSSLYHDHLVQLVRSGAVPESAVDEAAGRVLRVKFALGLFKHPYTDESKEAGAMLHPDSIMLARTAAEQSFVLLKNDPVAGIPLLPLSVNAKTLALVGPLADDRGNMFGSWAGLGRSEDVITLRAALSEKIGSQNLHYAKGTEIEGGSNDQLTEAVEAAQQSDVVVLAIGENGPEMTGEAASRAFLGLPGRQEELLEKIVATRKPVIIVIFSGRPLTLPWAFEHVPAVMAAWFPGIQAGAALVRTLFGEVSPSGRLVVSWPRSVGQEPLYYDALNTGRPPGDGVDPTEKKYVSRYIDEENSPQFPFGFGLSYTAFRYTNLKVDNAQLSANVLNEALKAHKSRPSTVLTASADITNAGPRAGTETVQLYLRLQGTSVAQPVRALAGFQRITLAPGETKKVTFHLGPEAFAIWNDQQEFAAEPAKLTLWIAPDSTQGLSSTLEITK